MIFNAALATKNEPYLLPLTCCNVDLYLHLPNPLRIIEDMFVDIIRSFPQYEHIVTIHPQTQKYLRIHQDNDTHKNLGP